MKYLALIAACMQKPPGLGVVSPHLEAIAGPASTCSGAPSHWVDRSISRDQIRVAAGLEVDADRAAAGLRAVRGALASDLGVSSDATPAALVWLTTASQSIRSGVAMTESNSTSVTVFLYSPSCDHDPRPRQFEKSIAQELSGEYLQAATTARDRGWRFYSAPSWFVQGAEGWVTTRVHDVPSDLVAVAVERATAPPEDAISTDGAKVVVENVYRDGEALVAWLTLASGPEVLARLLANDAPTFEDALVEVAKFDSAGLVANYLQWRSRASAE